MVAWLLTSKSNRTLRVLTIGFKVSKTVTVAVSIPIFPLLSVTVSVTVFSPIFEQLKLVTSKTMLAIEQLSDEPSFICSTVIFAIPVVPNETEMFFTWAIGCSLSKIVTIAVSELTFPLLSVTVNVTVFGPKSEQLN